VTETRFLGLAQRVKKRVLDVRFRHGLSAAARAEMKREQLPQSRHDVPIDLAISEALAWLGRAQDQSLSADGGVARHYCLITGWGESYPETTGYIIPTLIREARLSGDRSLLERARRMLDWLVRIQMPCGGFQGGTIGESPVVPVTFNTGQSLIGLAAGVSEFGDAYRQAMVSAADWLVATQDPDGGWRKHSTPFAAPGEKAYESHVAWGLLEAARLEPGRGYGDAGVRNMHWALSHQNGEGWFANCCLSDPVNPLTHTLGYVLRGLIAGYEFSREEKILREACRAAEGALTALQPDGFLPGRLDSEWRATVPWACLTGTVQMAACWLLLYRATGDVRFRTAGLIANRYVRSTMRFDGPLETRGAIKGSFPVSGGYATFQYPNWACKFFIDSNSLEKSIYEEESVAVGSRARVACPAD
jgi:Squalene-hopene cyclase C-terminal domain